MVKYISLSLIFSSLFCCQNKNKEPMANEVYSQTLSVLIDSLFIDSEINVPLVYTTGINVLQTTALSLKNKKAILYSPNHNQNQILRRFEKNITPLDSSVIKYIKGEKFTLFTDVNKQDAKGLIEITNFQYDEKINLGVYSFSFFLGKKGSIGYLLFFIENSNGKYKLIDCKEIWIKKGNEIKFHAIPAPLGVE